MGRHPKDALSLRSEGIRLRLTTAEYSWIKVMAKEQNVSMREMLWQSFREHWLEKLDPDTFGALNAKVVEEMKRMEKSARK